MVIHYGEQNPHNCLGKALEGKGGRDKESKGESRKSDINLSWKFLNYLHTGPVLLFALSPGI